MPNNNDDIKWLYGKLKSKGYDIGSEQDFSSSLANEEDRKWYYDKAKGMGLDMGSMDDFNSLYAPKQATQQAAPAAQPAQPQQKPTATPQPQTQAEQPVQAQKPEKQKGTPMTEQQKIAMSWQLHQTLNQANASMRQTQQNIKDIQTYGKKARLGGQTVNLGKRYNADSGKMEDVYMTPTGQKTNSKALADKSAHEYRVRQGFFNRMKQNGLDPESEEDMQKQHQLDVEEPMRNAVAELWKEAEAQHKADSDKAAQKAHSEYMSIGGGREARVMQAGQYSHDRAVSHLTRFDLQKMMDDAWDRLGEHKQKDYENMCYGIVQEKNPDASEEELRKKAREMARGYSDSIVFQYATEKKTPQSTLEFFASKVLSTNVLGIIHRAIARSDAGTTGDMAATDYAMEQYGKQHRFANIAGTVVGMGVDPVTWVSGGIGSFAGKGATNLAGRVLLQGATKEAAARYAAGTLAGRMIGGVVGGGVNFATYETLKAAEQQFMYGEYSAQELLGQTAHGLMMGSITGSLSPLIGNFADKAVKATSSTAGKVWLRVGETAVSTLAEGTIFAIPDIVSINRLSDEEFDAQYAHQYGYDRESDPEKKAAAREQARRSASVDVWDDSMLLMLGFKASHAIKSAPRMLDALKTEGKRYGLSFEERLRKQMDASPADAGFTKEELAELRDKGYMDLSMLFADASNRKAAKQKSAGKPNSRELGFRLDDTDIYENLTPNTFDGYEAMKRLMNDNTVSEAARAKAYYILTGRMLPMSTITGYTMDTAEDGSVVVSSMSAQGSVITSRRFANEKAAQQEIDNIMRQAELNSVQVGEQYKETASNIMVVETAIKEVLPEADMQTVLRSYKMVKSGELTDEAYVSRAKAIDAAIERNRGVADSNRPEAIRARLKEETGLDVDETLRKTPSKRTAEEQALVERYVQELFPEQERNEQGQTAEEARDAEFRLKLEDRQRSYEQGEEAFKVADETGDRADIDEIIIRMQEAREEIDRVFADDAEIRLAQLEDDPWAVVNDETLTPDQQDAVMYYINSKAAMDGLTEAANGNAEDKRADIERQVAQHTNKQSGMIHPATLKIDDKPVYIVSGNAVMFPDGSSIDVAKSSESIVVCDAETGEMKFVSPEMLLKVDEPISAEEEMSAALEAIEAEKRTVLGDAVPETAENDQETTNSVPETTENVPELTQEGIDNAFRADLAQRTGTDNGLVGEGLQSALTQQTQLAQQNYEAEQQAKAEAEAQRKAEQEALEATALYRIPKDENGAPMLEQTDPETAWDGVVEYMEDEGDAQEYVQSMVTQLTKDVEAAKKAVAKVKPTGDMAQFKADKSAARQAQAEVEARLEQWQSIANVNKQRKDAEQARINAERAEQQRIAHDKAVAELEEQKRIEAEKQAEQEAVGTHAVNPKIKAKWDAATKVEGAADVITLPDGSQLRGHYVLTEAGAATASHDANNVYKPTEGFPIDENGQSVNDRDYERDQEAQQIVRSIAGNFDNRALQTPVIVSKDGIVFSGNNRTMSGDMAAKNGTDGAYIDYLREFAQKYGLTAEQVSSMQHPRVQFVPDEALPYDAATFARFNAQEMKTQSKPEAAVKLGKVVPDATFDAIARTLAQYDRPSDFYANEKDANAALMELMQAGVINDKELPGLRTGNALSAAGKELLENTLIGKVFQSNPDAVRQIIAQPGLKQGIVIGLSEIAHNRTLADKGYDLTDELAKAIDLVARAKAADPDLYKEGVPVSPFGRQMGLFDYEFGEETSVTDATTLLLADILNSNKPSDLRKVLAAYNAEGATAASGQLDMFSGDLRSKEEILTDINNHFINATPKEQQAIVDAAIAERKRRAVEAAPEQGERGNTGEQAPSTETSSGQPATVEQAPEEGGFVAPKRRGNESMANYNARVAKAKEAWEKEQTAKADAARKEHDREATRLLKADNVEVVKTNDFGDAIVRTTHPETGEVLLGIRNRNGMTGYYPQPMSELEAELADKNKPMESLFSGEKTFEEFVDGIEVKNEKFPKKAEGTVTKKQKGGKHTYAESVSVVLAGDNLHIKTGGYYKAELVIPGARNYGASDITLRIEEGIGVSTDAARMIGDAVREIWQKEGLSQMSTYAQTSILRPMSKPKAESDKESAPIGTTSATEEISAARAATNTNPTEAQKEAGNYAKGHIKVDGHDITLENPKGSTRSGKDKNGKEWSITMNYDYGYIKGTKGVDGDHIDVYLSDNPASGNVYVVDQIEQESGDFDEHKVMYGFNSKDEAENAYLSQYEKGWLIGNVTEVSREDFKKWIESSHRKTKPFSEYKAFKGKDNESVISRYEALDAEHSNLWFERMSMSAEDRKADVEGAARLKELAERRDNLIRNLSDEELAALPEAVGNNFDDANGMGAIWSSETRKRNADKEAASFSDKQKNVVSLIKEFNTEWYKWLTDENNETWHAKRNSLQADIYKALSELTDEEVFALNDWKRRADNGNEDVFLSGEADKRRLSKGHVLYGTKLLETQGELPSSEYKAKKFDPYNYVGADKDKPAYNGVRHEDGYAIATDGMNVVVDKTGYDKSKDGKSIDKKGNELEGKYPNWKGILPKYDQKVEGAVDVVAQKLGAIETKIKELHAEAKEKGENPGSLAKFQEDAHVIMLMPNGNAVTIAYPRLAKFIAAGKHLGITDIEYKDGMHMLYGHNENGHDMVAPSRPDFDDAIANYKPFVIDLREVKQKPATPADPMDELMNDDGSNPQRYNVDAINEKGTKAAKAEQDKANKALAEKEGSKLQFNGEVSKDDFNDALKGLRDILGIDDSEGNGEIMFRDPGELTREQKAQLRLHGLNVTQVLMDNGIVSFPDYAKWMVGNLGDKVRPWLKSFYEGMRLEPGYEDLDFTPHDEVVKFDVANFDKPNKDLLKQAEMVVEEQKVANDQKAQEEAAKQKVLDTYNNLKSKHPEAKLMFRAGDFYELYQDDAKVASEVLGVPITERNGLQVVAFPHHALDTYLPKMIRAGHRVAICDQLDEPKKIKREAPKKETAPTKETEEKVTSKAKAELKEQQQEQKDLFGDTEQEDTSKKPARGRKIEDYGEVIAGARKNALNEIAKNISNINVETLVAQPLSKVWKKPNLKKMVDDKAITEEEATFLETVAQFITQSKKPATLKSGNWRKQRREQEIREWAESTNNKLSVFKQFVEGDDELRKKMMDYGNTISYPLMEAEKGKVEEMKELNKHRYENPEEQFAAWGKCFTPNPLYVYMQTLKGMGYEAGDKVSYPMFSVKASTAGDYYEAVGSDGRRSVYLPNTTDVDEMIGNIVAMNKVMRGDADAQIPESMLRPRVVTYKTQGNGTFRVAYHGGRGSYGINVREFGSREEAEAFAKKHEGAVIDEQQTRVADQWAVGFTDLEGNKVEAATVTREEGTKVQVINGDHFDTKEEAMRAIQEDGAKYSDIIIEQYRKEYASKKEDNAPKERQFKMYYYQGGVAYMLSPKEAGDWKPVSPIFKNSTEAKAWMKEHRAEVEAQVDKLREKMNEHIYFTDEKPREGKDWRNGKDVTPQQFGETFGFRGVQFGNWANDADRQAALNNGYDSLMDMAELMGITPKAISLNGELGIAFGARGTGSANAHYELQEVVINLTKTRGAGSLAHEWWHALDNYFSRMAGMPLGMVTHPMANYEIRRKNIVRGEVMDAYDKVVRAIWESSYGKRQSLNKSSYWKDPVEMSARLLDAWVGKSFAEQGQHNGFLTHAYEPEYVESYRKSMYEIQKGIDELRGVDTVPYEEYRKNPESLGLYVNPSPEEMVELAPVMREFFDTLKEKESDNGSMLYESDEEYGAAEHVQLQLFTDDGEPYVHAGSLPKLEEGEFSLVEREFTKNGYYGFSGGTIESTDDIAYILRNLETKAVENAFAVFVADGKATVVHVGMGHFTATAVNMAGIRGAFDKFGAEKVYFVHNHPSGKLEPSTDDRRTLQTLREMLPGKVEDGIIIDTMSGQYSMFGDSTYDTSFDVRDRAKKAKGKETTHEVYEFDKLVFSPDYDVKNLQKIKSSDDVAAFLSSQRLGERGKVGLIVTNNALQVVGNFHLPYNDITSDVEGLANEIVRIGIRYGGNALIPYGNFKMDAGSTRKLGERVRALSGRGLQIVDVVSRNTKGVDRSAVNEGWSLREGETGYMAREVDNTAVETIAQNHSLDRNTVEDYAVGLATNNLQRAEIGLDDMREDLKRKLEAQGLQVESKNPFEPTPFKTEWHKLMGELKAQFGDIVDLRNKEYEKERERVKLAEERRLAEKEAARQAKKNAPLKITKKDVWQDRNISENPRIGSKEYDPRNSVPAVRGGWTEKKVLNYLKHNASNSALSTAARFIAEFDTPEELKKHMFYHGTVYGTSQLKPSITMSDRQIERIGGGGSGQKYWAISLTSDKPTATNFSGMSNRVKVYPVVLSKNAKVVVMDKYQDSADIEDDVTKLWNEGVDAVIIGSLDKGEHELAVLNPRAIAVIDNPEYYDVYGLRKGDVKVLNDEQIAELHKNAIDYYNNPARQMPAKPQHPMRTEMSDEQYAKAMAEYEAAMEEYRSSEELREYEKVRQEARGQIRFRLREGKEPTKTIRAFKLFDVDDNGRPHALFIDANNALGYNAWYDADSPSMADLENLEVNYSYLMDANGNVVERIPTEVVGEGGKRRFKGLPGKRLVNNATDNGMRWMAKTYDASGAPQYHTIGINGSGGVTAFALRPGWHATDVPSARHIGEGKNGGEAKFRRANQRWFEVELAADNDYNEEVRERYLQAHPNMSREEVYENMKGDMPEHIPTDGFYDFKTNSNANPNQRWLIAGSMKILRPVSEEEAHKIARQRGVEIDLPYKDGKKSFVEEDLASDTYSMQERAQEIANNLNTPVHFVTSADEVSALPTARRRKAKGWTNIATGEVTIVVPNNANIADIENTTVHEIVAHKGLRALVGEENMNTLLDEIHEHAEGKIREAVDGRVNKMVADEVDRLTRQKNAEEDRPNNRKGVFSRAEATVEAEQKREQFRREATEEYMADMAGRIGEEGFKKMEVEELTFWGKIKERVMNLLNRLFAGKKWAKNVKITDKDIAYILYRSYKNLRNGGRSTIMDAAEDAVMRSKLRYNDGGKQPTWEEKRNALTEVTNKKSPNGNTSARPKSNLPNRAEAPGLLPNHSEKSAAKVARISDNLKGLFEKVSDKGLGANEMRYMLAEALEIGDSSSDHSNYNVVLVGDGVETEVRVSNHSGNASYLRKDNNIGIVIKTTNQRFRSAKDKDYIEFMYYGDKVAGNAPLQKEIVDGLRHYIETGSFEQMPEPDRLNPSGEYKRQLNALDEQTLFRDSDMGLEETITSMKAEIASKNADDFNAKVDAMKAIGGNLNKLRSAMAKQKAYDVSTAKAMTDLATVLMDKGLLESMSAFETKRVLSAVKNAVGKEDITGHVQKLMDIMVDNQLHAGANMLGRLFSVRGSKVNDRGVEVQGSLDPKGQLLVKVARKYTSFPKAEIDATLIPDLISRMGDSDQTIADNAAIELEGVQIARRYVEEITESKVEEKALRESIKKAKEDKDAGLMDAAAYKQYVKATEEAIRENKIERAEAYTSIAEQFGGILGESAERAKAWREAEQDRINEIHHNSNSDMEGRPTDEHHKDTKVQKIMNNSAVRFLLAPLGTFDQMLRMFGKKNVNGEGYLWNRFMRGWVDATEGEYTGYKDALNELDAKVSEVYGKKMKWSDLFALERKLPKASVEFWDGGERKMHELSQGNLLYIYMADKMADGRMKLRYMGITEDDVDNITDMLDPRFKELADWMQDEFLVAKRNKYNEVHKRMFGAPMAAIDNYFPLKILQNALDKNEDVAEDDNAGIVLPGTTTSGIIKRRRNNKPLDVTGADAFSVVLDHVQEMEHWAAFAELTRDINTMLSYKRFRNQVMNMSSAYGAGATLWKNFRNASKMAVGAYRPPVAELDKAAVNIAKGVTAAKVSFRVFTALKQLLSAPAYLPDANPLYLMKNVANPVGAWKWAMDNLPIFDKRWSSRMAGDPRLMKSEMDWKMWRSRVVEIASRIGMSPNAFVDAVTVSIGAHSMYQTRYAKYRKWGFDHDAADKRARQDATILFNETQQSSEGAFLSTMQVDRSWLSTLFTVFRNSSMSYTRQEYDALRNEVKLFTPGYRQRAQEFMAKQLRREGLTDEQAEKAARSELRKGPLRNLARVAVFGFVMQAAWNLGAYLPYLVLGDDDEQKEDMLKEAFTHAYVGSLEGLTGGDVMSNAGNLMLKGEGNWQYLVKDMPIVSDLSSILKKWPKDHVEALNDCVNLLVQSGIGVNPQSITDALVAIVDACGDDAETSKECALLIGRIINCPPSQLEKIYFDELGVDGIEASKMTPRQIAERYARYKRRRQAPMTGWLYSDAEKEAVEAKHKTKAETKAKENLGKLTDGEDREALQQWRDEYKATLAEVKRINRLKDTDEDAYDDALDELEANPSYERYEILNDYKRDISDLTKEWMNAETVEDRERTAQAMKQLKAEMVAELKAVK